VHCAEFSFTLQHNNTLTATVKTPKAKCRHNSQESDQGLSWEEWMKTCGLTAVPQPYQKLDPFFCGLAYV